MVSERLKLPQLVSPDWPSLNRSTCGWGGCLTLKPENAVLRCLPKLHPLSHSSDLPNISSVPKLSNYLMCIRSSDALSYDEATLVITSVCLCWIGLVRGYIIGPGHHSWSVVEPESCTSSLTPQCSSPGFLSVQCLSWLLGLLRPRNSAIWKVFLNSQWSPHDCSNCHSASLCHLCTQIRSRRLLLSVDVSSCVAHLFRGSWHAHEAAFKICRNLQQALSVALKKKRLQHSELDHKTYRKDCNL